jgi:hypothetical protein
VEPANGPTSVSVTWASGSRAGRTELIDLAPIIYTFKIFRLLRENPTLFASVRLGEWGASILWGDDNPDLEVGADALEELAEETMTNMDFASFMKRHRLSLDATAAWLGVSRRLVAYYAKERYIPRPIALACKYLDLVGDSPEEQRTAKDAGIRGEKGYSSDEMRTRHTAQSPLHEVHRDIGGSLATARTRDGSFVLTKPGAKRRLVSREKTPGDKR